MAPLLRKGLIVSALIGLSYSDEFIGKFQYQGYRQIFILIYHNHSLLLLYILSAVG